MAKLPGVWLLIILLTAGADAAAANSEPTPGNPDREQAGESAQEKAIRKMFNLFRSGIKTIQATTKSADPNLTCVALCE